MEEILPIDPQDIQMNLTEIGSVECRIVIQLTARQAKRFHKKLKKTGQDASAESTTQHLTNFCIEQGIKRFNLEPIFGPEVTQDTAAPTYQTGQGFILSIDVDKSPEITWPDFTSLTLIRPIREVTEDMINREMVEQQRDAGIKESHSGPIKAGDELLCNVFLSEKDNDEPLYKQLNVSFRTPDESGNAKIFNLEVEGLAKELLSSSSGNTISVETVVPDDYLDPTLCGQIVNIQVEIIESLRINPATTEEVVKQYGSPSETILRRQISMALESKIARDQHAWMSKQIFDQLSNSVTIPIPERVENQFFNALVQSTESYMANLGCNSKAIIERIESRTEDIKTMSCKLARKRSLANLLCQHFEIKMHEEKIIAHIGQIAAEQGRRPEELRKEIMESGRLQSVGVQVMEQEAMSKILEYATLTDMPAEKWLEQQKTTASTDE